MTRDGEPMEWHRDLGGPETMKEGMESLRTLDGRRRVRGALAAHPDLSTEQGAETMVVIELLDEKDRRIAELESMSLVQTAERMRTVADAMRDHLNKEYNDYRFGKPQG